MFTNNAYARCKPVPRMLRCSEPDGALAQIIIFPVVRKRAVSNPKEIIRPTAGAA
jgi:hypothetical protein